MTAEISPDVLAAAIEAAMQLNCERWNWDRDTPSDPSGVIRASISAAVPIIAAAVEAETERRVRDEIAVEERARLDALHTRTADVLAVWRAEERARSAVPANSTEENR